MLDLQLLGMRVAPNFEMTCVFFPFFYFLFFAAFPPFLRRDIVYTASEDDCFEMLCHGRLFEIGELYNRNKDIKVVGPTLWTTKELKEMTSVVEGGSCTCTYSESTKRTERMTMLDVSGSLKLSLMSNMINLEGSGKFLQDDVDCTRHKTASLNYTLLGGMRRIRFDTKITFPSVKKVGATHIVVGVQYGGTAIFTYKETCSKDHKILESGGRLAGEFNKLKVLSVSGEVKIKHENKENSEKHSTELSYNGDFHLSTVPGWLLICSAERKHTKTCRMSRERLFWRSRFVIEYYSCICL